MTFPFSSLVQNDLLFLKVTSQLHHLSIKCAIHVLHVNKFDPHCLRRRPGDEVSLLVTAEEITRWAALTLYNSFQLSDKVTCVIYSQDTATELHLFVELYIV